MGAKVISAAARETLMVDQLLGDSLDMPLLLGAVKKLMVTPYQHYILLHLQEL